MDTIEKAMEKLKKSIEKLVRYVDIFEKENEALAANNTILRIIISNQSIRIFKLQAELNRYKEECAALLENMERSDETD